MKRLQLPSLLLLSIFFVFTACTSNDQENEENKTIIKKVIPSGVISHVVSEIDNSQSYEIYLPSYYNAGRKFPIIVVFDPQGNGIKAVSNFNPSFDIGHEHPGQPYLHRPSRSLLYVLKSSVSGRPYAGGTGNYLSILDVCCARSG